MRPICGDRLDCLPAAGQRNPLDKALTPLVRFLISLDLNPLKINNQSLFKQPTPSTNHEIVVSPKRPHMSLLITLILLGTHFAKCFERKMPSLI